MAINSTDQGGDVNSIPRQKRILVVEDEVLIAIDVAQMLKSAGYEVKGPCIRKSDAERLMLDQDFDGALLDFNLGNGETSLSIAEYLRLHRIPFAFLTGNSARSISDVDGEFTVISKPVSRTLIMETIAGW